MINVFERVLELQKAGQAGVLVTVVEKQGSAPLSPGARMLVCADGRTVGTIGGGSLELIATRRAVGLLGERQCLLQPYSLTEQSEAIEGEPTGMLCGGRVVLFFEYLSTAARLYLFGGGHVGQALVRQLGALDYHVTVVDERVGIAQGVPDADQVVVADFEKELEDPAVPKGAYFVVATPSHRSDYLVMRRLLTSGCEPRYVGVIASRKKAAGFLNDLRSEFGDSLDLSPLYMPIGLDLGGSSAAEIAVSIVAELQAVRYARTDLRHMRLEGLR